MILITRYHDFSCGHRVMHGEGQCARLHGHNYRVTFKVQAPIDETGHAIEFSAIKSKLCAWLEDNWDHRFLLYIEDPMGMLLRNAAGAALYPRASTDAPLPEAQLAAKQLQESICYVPFHPTTENIANYLLQVVGPTQLEGTGARLVMVEVSETRKCGAIALIDPTDDMKVHYQINGDPASIAKAMEEGAIPDSRQEGLV